MHHLQEAELLVRKRDSLQITCIINKEHLSSVLKMLNKCFVDPRVIQHQRKFISFRVKNKNKKQSNQNLTPNLKLINKSIVSKSLRKMKLHTGLNIDVSLRKVWSAKQWIKSPKYIKSKNQLQSPPKEGNLQQGKLIIWHRNQVSYR